MPVIEDYPDLSHWRTIQEFTIEQAALLLAGIDPYDYMGGLVDVRNCRHQRWKMAWGLSEGIISAIRRGVLTPIVCIGETTSFNSYDGEYYTSYEAIKQTDRTKDICKGKTIITRDSLMSWLETERVDFVRKPRPVVEFNEINNQQDHFVLCEETKNTDMILLPPQRKHRSEGLSYVDDAIEQFWGTYDEEDPGTAPTKQEIIDYLTSKGVSNNLAEAVDLVLRPFHVRKVGRRKSNKS